VLLGATLPNGGTIEYFGLNFFEHKHDSLRRINFASAYHNLQNRTTVRQNLLVFADLYEVADKARKIDRLIDYFEVRDIAERRFGDLSAGQRTRVHLIKSLLNDPELILMDEPTASLDPDIADKTLSLIEELRRERDLSILFTSHKMDEVSRICDDVVFLDHGEVVARGTPSELTRRIPEAELRLTFSGAAEIVTAYLSGQDFACELVTSQCVAVTVRESAIAPIVLDLDRLGIAITDVDVRKTDLEDIFIQIARRSLVS